jgi:hypothetical protein
MRPWLADVDLDQYVGRLDFIYFKGFQARRFPTPVFDASEVAVGTIRTRHDA